MTMRGRVKPPRNTFHSAYHGWQGPSSGGSATDGLAHLYPAIIQSSKFVPPAYDYYALICGLLTHHQHYYPISSCHSIIASSSYRQLRRLPTRQISGIAPPRVTRAGERATRPSSHDSSGGSGGYSARPSRPLGLLPS